MKNLFVFSLVFLFSVYSAKATFSINVSVNSEDDISEYFDLELVATQFAKSRNLNDLERRINDPVYRVSNLDLNEDGYIDFIRVIKQSDINNDMIILQAVLGANYYQDLATIYVDRNKYQKDYVLIVGDPYLFGDGYWIEPEFFFTPRIIKWLWRNAHYDFFSPYRWNFYPDYYSFSPILPLHIYWNNVRSWVDYNHHYYYVDSPRFRFDIHFDRSHHRNDHFDKYPNKRFKDRNTDFKNKRERNDNIRREKNLNEPREKSGSSRTIETRKPRTVTRALPTQEKKVDVRPAPERKIESRPAPERKVESRPAPERKVESRPAPERKVESRPAPERKIESRPAPERKVESRPAPERKVEPRPSPAREKKPVDVKPERVKEKKDDSR